MFEIVAKPVPRRDDTLRSFASELHTRKSVAVANMQESKNAEFPVKFASERPGTKP
jgi:hypothetical protein